MAKLTILTAVALACAVAVQGASLGGNATLVARACEKPDATPSVCQTSGGSPLVSDCVQALKQLTGNCEQSNDVGSHCKTQVKYGTCKIDACGQDGAQIPDDVNCGGYLQTILNDCQSGGRVGGHLVPKICNVDYSYPPTDPDYWLQFSHS
ncbi:hypothetical protein C8Q80DRAFT_1353411 [Daedaleopsis nitida]|nr:hypothetical protein C8Q80DRAFT_1353411 [Daedaleopsis nitida]